MIDTGYAGGAGKAGAEFDSDVKRWCAELDAAERVFRDWRNEARGIRERFTLERERSVSKLDLQRKSQRGGFNILHSNIETMRPAIYGAVPRVVVQRVHGDSDPVGRVAAQILERALRTEMEGERDRTHETLKRVAEDLLLTGRGVPWISYVPELREDEIVGQSTTVDYVLWSDFLHSPRYDWSQVERDGWVARRVSMTREAGVKRFGEVFRQVPLNARGAGFEGDDDQPRAGEDVDIIGRADVWEIHDAVSRRQVWICRDYKAGVLDARDDPLQLEGFFPCPEPAFGTTDGRRLVPVPDFLHYRGMAEDLDRITRRIRDLVEAVLVKGFYDARMEGIETMLSSQANTLHAVENMSAAQGAGLDNVIKFMPLKETVGALVALYDARDRVKQSIYEISGLSDIMRGQVDPREKLGQSRLKGQFAAQRLQDKVAVMERVGRDCLAIRGEIMAEHYEDGILRALSGFDYMAEVEAARRDAREAYEAEMAQYEAEMAQMTEEAEAQGLVPPLPQMLPPPPSPPPDPGEEMFAAALELLRNEKLRGFRLSLETGSTLMLDEDEDKQRRNEFMEAMAMFMQHAVSMMQMMPESAPLMLEMMQFQARGFRAGRALEPEFEKLADLLRNPRPAEEEGPSPEEAAAQAKAETEMAVLEAKTQADMAVRQADMQSKLMQLQLKAQEMTMKAQAEERKTETDAALTQAELEVKLQEIDIEREKLELEVEAMRRKALIELATDREKSNDEAKS